MYRTQHDTLLRTIAYLYGLLIFTVGLIVGMGISYQGNDSDLWPQRDEMAGLHDTDFEDADNQKYFERQ